MDYPYGKIRILAQNLERFDVEEGLRKRIMEGGEAIRQSDKNERKAEWLRLAMDRMDAALEPGLRRRIRESCACCLGGKRHEACVGIRKAGATIAERIAIANETTLVFGNGVRELGKGRYEVSFFPDDGKPKACPCVKGLSAPMSLTYCYCCGGHVKYHLQTALGVQLEVEVKETALSTQGERGCRFELVEAVVD